MATLKFIRVKPGILVEVSLAASRGEASAPAVHDGVVGHYAPLLGRTIKEIRFERDEVSGDPLPILVFEDGSSAAVLCDPEGNGPGHLDVQQADVVQPLPPPEDGGYLVVFQHKKPHVFSNHRSPTLEFARGLAKDLLGMPGADYCIIQGPGLPPNGERVEKLKQPRGRRRTES